MFGFGSKKQKRDKRGRFTKTGVKKFDPENYNLINDYFMPHDRIQEKETKSGKDKAQLADLEKQYLAYKAWDDEQPNGLKARTENAELKEEARQREIDRELAYWDAQAAKSKKNK